MESRRDTLKYLAAAFALPAPAWLLDAASRHVPVYASEPDARTALSTAWDRLDFLAVHYCLPTTDSQPVLEEAASLWKDASVIRAKLTGHQAALASTARVVEGKAATLVGHLTAERGEVDAGTRWFRRAHDAGITAGNDAGLEVAGRAVLLDLADRNTAAKDPDLAEREAFRIFELVRNVHGTTRAMAVSTAGRALARKGDNARALDCLQQAGQWAAVALPDTAPISLFSHTPRHHHYVAAGVMAHLGEVGRSVEHRARYLDGAAPGFMNQIILELGQTPNIARRDGFGAGAAHVAAVVEAIPAPRRSSPVRDHARQVTADLEGAVARRSGVGAPAELVKLRAMVSAMSAPDYLATVA